MYNLYTCIELPVLFYSLIAIVRKQIGENVETFYLVSKISLCHSIVLLTNLWWSLYELIIHPKVQRMWTGSHYIFAVENNYDLLYHAVDCSIFFINAFQCMLLNAFIIF